MTEKNKPLWGMRAFRSDNLQYDQYLIVIAGDVWRITGDDNMTVEWKYIGEFRGPLMYEATQIDPKDVPKDVIETAKRIAVEYYAADWYDFAATTAAKPRTRPQVPICP